MSGGETPPRLWNYFRMGNPFNRLTPGGETPQWADVRRRNLLYELTSGRETPNGLASWRETPHYGLTSGGISSLRNDVMARGETPFPFMADVMRRSFRRVTLALTGQNVRHDDSSVVRKAYAILKMKIMMQRTAKENAACLVELSTSYQPCIIVYWQF